MPDGEGQLRRMTSGEIALTQTLYSNQIAYSKVWIHCDSYLPLGLQAKNVAMTPNGEVYFREGYYYADFSADNVSIDSKHIFLHELCHVWQYQHGMMVKLRGLFSWAVDYHYDLAKTRLSCYSMEQQASIVSDYYILRDFGYSVWQGLWGNNFINKDYYYNNVELLRMYEKVLGSFPSPEEL
ncbi:type IV secretion protein Rhs [Rouxiella sp. Mn2063]|uniref:type IV secretion protein Rhs n=1 Tax=Rouxiella sp. Mn2063 TaxID=3395262 RepID=UPI003BE3134C